MTALLLHWGGDRPSAGIRQTLKLLVSWSAHDNYWSMSILLSSSCLWLREHRIMASRRCVAKVWRDPVTVVSWFRKKTKTQSKVPKTSATKRNEARVRCTGARCNGATQCDRRCATHLVDTPFMTLCWNDLDLKTYRNKLEMVFCWWNCSDLRREKMFEWSRKKKSISKFFEFL